MKYEKIITFEKIFGKFNETNAKYTWNPCPSFETKSKQLTDCITQMIRDKLSEIIKKKLVKL